jgi:hypothetical protein
MHWESKCQMILLMDSRELRDLLRKWTEVEYWFPVECANMTVSKKTVAMKNLKQNLRWKLNALYFILLNDSKFKHIYTRVKYMYLLQVSIGIYLFKCISCLYETEVFYVVLKALFSSPSSYKSALFIFNVAHVLEDWKLLSCWYFYNMGLKSLRNICTA